MTDADDDPIRAEAERLALNWRWMLANALKSLLGHRSDLDASTVLAVAAEIENVTADDVLAVDLAAALRRQRADGAREERAYQRGLEDRANEEHAAVLDRARGGEKA